MKRFRTMMAVSFALFLGVSVAHADGIGPFGYPNLFVNPDFENATVPSDSNHGNWGWFKDGLVTLYGWTGSGNAGVASTTDRDTWLSALPENDNYRVFIQMQNGFADGYSYIEQTVTPEKSGTYAFTCRYATRHIKNGSYDDPGTLGFSIACNGVTNEFGRVAFSRRYFEYQNTTRFLTLAAGQSYTFRLYGVADKTTDRTAMIASCALERLPQSDISITGEYHLVADEDWSDETVYLAPGARVHLDGHNLMINGSVRLGVDNTDAVFTDETANPGELRVTVPAGAEFVNYGYSVAGGITFVKDGPGTFTWNGGTIAATVPITVAGGVFKANVTVANAFGSSGTITVKAPGQFDIHYPVDGGHCPAGYRTFYIEGDGPDGTGAIVNNAYVDLWGYHLNTVIMTGDATIGGNSRIDFRGNNIGIDGVGYTLTIKNTGMLAFCGGNAHLTCKNVIVADGGVFQPCSGCVLNIAEGVALVNGGVFANWANANTTQEFHIPVEVGEGGGTFRSDARWFAMSKPVTVKAGNALTCATTTPWYQAPVTNEVNATLTIRGDFFAAGGIFVNEGAVSHTGGNLYFGSRDDTTHPCRVENGGTIRTSGGNFFFKAESSATGTGVFDLAGAADISGDLSGFTGTLRVSDGWAKIPSVATLGGTLVLAGGDISNSLAAVTCPVVFDLSDKTEPFSIPETWLSLPANKAVTIELRGRRLVLGEKLIEWETAPNLVFMLDDAAAMQGVQLVRAEDGLYFGAGSGASVARATWTGAAMNGEFADVRNWVCYDVNGNVIDTIPVPETVITLGADVPFGGWATFATASQTGSINLNGHRLVLQPANNSAITFAVTDSSTDTSHPGELHITLGKGVNFSKTSDFDISGNLALVVDGEGSFTWSGGTLAAAIPITVTGGVFKVGVTTENVFGTSGTITVKAPGQFDINYGKGGKSAPVRARTFYIEGAGPDGVGAIVNTSSENNWGYHLNHVIMTGDATIGGRARIDFRGSGLGIDGAGYTLTIKNTGMIALCGGAAYLNCGNVIVTDDGVFQPCSGCVLNIAGDITLVNGGVFANWADANTTQDFHVPVIVGEGGGTFKSDARWFSMNRPVTVKSGNTLTCATATPWYQAAVTNETDATLNIAGDFFATGGFFANEGLVAHTGGKMHLGSRDDQTHPCRVENNGTLTTGGGDFHFNFESSAFGTGTFEVTGGTAEFAGDFTGFTGTILLKGGSMSFLQPATFAGNLILREGTIASGTSLAGLSGTVTINLKDRDLPLDVEGKNWLTFADGKEVIIEVGKRKFQKGDQLLAWETRPANSAKIRFKLSNDQPGKLYADSTGLFYDVRGLIILLK